MNKIASSLAEQPVHFSAPIKKRFLANIHRKDNIVFLASDEYNLFHSWKYRKRQLTKLQQASHASINNFRWQAKHPSFQYLQEVNQVLLDIDCPISQRDELIVECLGILADYNILPQYIIKTPSGGFHILISVEKKNGYGISVNESRLKMILELETSLKDILPHADKSPTLTSFVRLPVQPNDIVLATTAEINVVSALKALRGIKTANQTIHVVKRQMTAFVDGTRNNSAYTLAMICRVYGKDKSYAQELIEAQGGCGATRELNSTIRSAYNARKNATNEWCRRLCLGDSVSQVARKYGIFEPKKYERKTAAEVLRTKQETLQKANNKRLQRTEEKKQDILKLREQGKKYYEIAIQLGISLPTVHRLSQV